MLLHSTPQDWLPAGSDDLILLLDELEAERAGDVGDEPADSTAS